MSEKDLKAKRITTTGPNSFKRLAELASIPKNSYQQRITELENSLIRVSEDNARLEQENYKLRAAFRKAAAQLAKAHQEGWLEEIPEPERPTMSYYKKDEYKEQNTDRLTF